MPDQPRVVPAASRLADTLRQDILDCGGNAGDDYMTEAQISERYGVSRSMTREAVSRLRGLGILTSRKSKGLIIREPDPARLMAQSLPFIVRSHEKIVEVARYRYILEIGAIDFAVDVATEEQLARMFALVDRWEACVRDGHKVKEGFEVDAAFHSLILEMSGVPLIAAMHKVVVDFFALTIWEAPVWPEKMNDNAWQHRAIANAIAARDLEQCRAQLRLHISYLRNYDANRYHRRNAAPQSPTQANGHTETKP